MTTVHYLPTANRSSQRPSLNGLQQMSDYVSTLYQSWHRDRMLRALEALPPSTLKDIGWPTADNLRMEIHRK